MTAPIKRTYFDTRDLAYDDVDILVLAPEGEIVARRKTIVGKAAPRSTMERPPTLPAQSQKPEKPLSCARRAALPGCGVAACPARRKTE